MTMQDSASTAQVRLLAHADQSVTVVVSQKLSQSSQFSPVVVSPHTNFNYND